jgi:hypothetical protein
MGGFEGQEGVQIFRFGRLPKSYDLGSMMGYHTVLTNLEAIITGSLVIRGTSRYAAVPANQPIM